jgi:probable O-glycosylation ligase (exosortase A-associated)
MALPMLFFLRWDVSNRYLLWLLRIAVPATIFSVILTYSRGDLVGLCVVLFGIALKSRRKLVGICLLGACTVLVLAFAPARWMDRMNNFAEGKLDRSAQERLDTWQFTLNFVEAYPLTGGSFGVFEDISVKRQYAPPHLASEEIFGLAGPHSIYFQILGEQGTIGLVFYLCLMGSCLLTLRRLRKRAGRNSDKAWVIPYCNMLEMGILAFAVSGATLGVAYFDLYFTLVALTSAIAIIYKRESAVMENSTQIAPVEELQPMLS